MTKERRSSTHILGHSESNIGKSVVPVGPLAQSPKCHQCGSGQVCKSGFYKNHQRWLCRDCGYRFSVCEGSERVQKVDRVSLNCVAAYSSNRQVCVSEAEGTKNLEEAIRLNQAKREATAQSPEESANTKGKLIEFSWWMQKQGYTEQTVLGRTQILKLLMKRGANLLEPETVKETIAKQKGWCEARKANAVISYSTFLRMHGGKWDPPRYKEEEKLPWIPQEKEIDDLIAGCSLRICCFLQVMKEGALRPGEAWRLKWIDVDYENRTITLNRPEKHSKSRQFRISQQLANVLGNLQRTRDSNPERIFNYVSTSSLRRCFERQRKRVAYRTGNPRLLRITFKTLRHWKATMEYHRTKDILHVMSVLGHKNIQNTLKYTHLVDLQEDEYISKVAKTTVDACALVESGFEYVCDIEGHRIFRKRK